MQHLLTKGHKVSVCTPAHGHEDIQFIDSLNTTMKVPVIFEKIGHSFPRLLMGLMSFKALSVSNFYSNHLQRKLDQLIQQNDFDVILCTSSSMAEYVFKSDEIQSRVTSNRPIILLMDFMDLDSDKWKQYSISSSWPMNWVYTREARLLARFESKIQQSFDHCFFISNNEVELFQNQIGLTQSVHVLGNGIDTDSFYPAEKRPENSDPVFIFTGVMDYKPNVDAVLWFMEHVWDLIREKYPHARYIIAGMNPSPVIQNLSSIPGIEVTGFVDDILPFYHQADYFVAPFTIARGVQNKILQAFACSLPVIASSLGAEGIECKDGEHILIAETGDEYLLAISKLESDPLLRTNLISAALKLIRDEYSWDGRLKALDSILERY